MSRLEAFGQLRGGLVASWVARRAASTGPGDHYEPDGPFGALGSALSLR